MKLSAQVIAVQMEMVTMEITGSASASFSNLMFQIQQFMQEFSVLQEVKRLP